MVNATARAPPASQIIGSPWAASEVAATGLPGATAPTASPAGQRREPLAAASRRRFAASRAGFRAHRPSAGSASG